MQFYRDIKGHWLVILYCMISFAYMLMCDFVFIYSLSGMSCGSGGSVVLLKSSKALSVLQPQLTD